MQTQDRIAEDFCERLPPTLRLQAGMNGVAGLRVGELKVEQVARLLADAGAAQSYAGRSERTQSARPARGRGRMVALAHAVSSLSG